MKNFGLLFLCLLIAAAITLACGSPSSTNRQLLSARVSPAAADAQSYPGGEVPFTATGYYTSSPTPVTPLGTTWGVCYQGASTTGVSIDSSTGVARCAVGSVGTFTIFTSNSANPHVSCLATTACGGGCFVTGTAQLSCP